MTFVDYTPVLTLPLDERLALALAEDCATELDATDIANVIEAVLPVARRYGARDVPPNASTVPDHLPDNDADGGHGSVR